MSTTCAPATVEGVATMECRSPDKAESCQGVQLTNLIIRCSSICLSPPVFVSSSLIGSR